MFIRKINKLREKAVSFFFKIIVKLENIGDTDIRKNGEEKFINNIIKSYAGCDNFCLFDVGANMGEYTEFFINHKELNKNSRFHLFEPQKKCFIDLTEKFGADTRIVLNNFGASNCDVSQLIYYDREKSGLASLYHRNLEFYKLELSQSEEIRLVALSKYVAERRIAKINLLKLDVEGHELKVLEGLEQYLNPDFIDYIQFEYGGANMDSHTNLLDFFQLLEGKGFKMCKIMKSGNIEYRKYDPRYDNFVYQNWVAVSNNIFKSA